MLFLPRLGHDSAHFVDCSALNYVVAAGALRLPALMGSDESTQMWLPPFCVDLRPWDRYLQLNCRADRLLRCTVFARLVYVHRSALFGDAVRYVNIRETHSMRQPPPGLCGASGRDSISSGRFSAFGSFVSSRATPGAPALDRPISSVAGERLEPHFAGSAFTIDDRAV